VSVSVLKANSGSSLIFPLLQLPLVGEHDMAFKPRSALGTFKGVVPAITMTIGLAHA